ncbi:eukaryotic translation initiation factor 3 subunit J-A [Engraulis encrasicolus]|uniref:eukaryotic translation initiation factor 3 subunit J-A n=1 Tax=Engraulis encrasicolus TaxID=184585 RepID=UPI002FD33178
MADGDSWDADRFEPDAPAKNPAGHDKWEGEDEEDDVKDNWDDEEEDAEDEEEKSGEKAAEVKPAEKKKLSDKIKERESLQRRRQEELRKRMEEGNESTDVTPDEEPMRVLPLQTRMEEAHTELADDSITVVSNHVAGIDDMSPSSQDDFTEFEKLLKEKITPYEKSVHYCPFLESLFRNVCLSLEVEDLKKVNNSLTALLNEKQKQDKSKAKKKKKGVVPAGGMKAKMKDDLDAYGEFDGGYAQDYEDFM